MPTNKFYHILCTSENKVVYEGRFQCVSRSAALKLLREKVGRQNLSGLVFTVTEIPIEVIREILEALLRKKSIPEGDIVPCTTPLNNNAGVYVSIRSNKHNPNKPKGAREVTRRLGDF